MLCLRSHCMNTSNAVSTFANFLEQIFNLQPNCSKVIRLLSYHVIWFSNAEKWLYVLLLRIPKPCNQSPNSALLSIELYIVKDRSGWPANITNKVSSWHQFISWRHDIHDIHDVQMLVDHLQHPCQTPCLGDRTTYPRLILVNSSLWLEYENSKSLSSLLGNRQTFSEHDSSPAHWWASWLPSGHPTCLQKNYKGHNYPCLRHCNPTVSKNWQ